MLYLPVSGAFVIPQSVVSGDRVTDGATARVETLDEYNHLEKKTELA